METVLGELSALLVKVNVPDAVPEMLGVNRTVTRTFRPTATVKGKVRSGRVNSELSDWAAEIVTLAPVAESVRVRSAREPTVTPPKSRLEGVMVRCAVPPITPTP